MGYSVDVQLPARPLGKADAIFEIKTNEGKLGELRISNGSLVWFPVNAKKGYRVDWKKFGEFMVLTGKKIEDR